MKYSIITVNYNNRDGLKKTIESVVCQTFRDYEFIVIDGGSTDGSVDVLKEYDDKITYWVSEPDKGIYNGMNKGIAKATGDYLNFMNSGDCFYADDVLQRVADYNSQADFIVGRDYHYNERLQRGHASIQPPRTTMMHFFVATLDHQSSFIRRELLADSPYDESHRLVSDWIFYVEKAVSPNSNVSATAARLMPTCTSCWRQASMPTMLPCRNWIRQVSTSFIGYAIITKCERHLFSA